jgi:hypothetical protein
LSQEEIFGVGIQTEPCYRRTVIHNKPFDELICLVWLTF